MFAPTKDISKPDPTIDNHRISQICGRSHRKERSTLGSRPDPIVVMNKISVDGLCWESGVCIAKLNGKTKRFSWRFPVIVYLDLEGAGKSAPLNRMPHSTSNYLGDKFTKASAGNIGAFDAVSVPQLSFAREPQSEGEEGNKSRRDGSYRVATLVKKSSQTISIDSGNHESAAHEF